MNAHVLTVGAEILAGDILDTNARDLALFLAGLGIPVLRKTTVPDVVEDIAAAVLDSLSRTDVLVVTGGLGPTPDDRTRQGLARAFGVECRLRPELLDVLRRRYLSYGHREMPDSNLPQVTLPDGAHPIPNPVGTAPGFRMERDGRVVFVLPGIPREMKRMMEDTVLPWLRANRPVRSLLSATLHTQGIGESELISRFGETLNALEGVEVAFYPQLPGVRIKLTAQVDDPEEARRRLDAASKRVRGAMGSYVFGAGGDRLPRVVLSLLEERGWKVATAESCTGGRLAAALTSVSGSSRTFERGLVTYSNQAKMELLGVRKEDLDRHGAVSETVARAMAEGVRERSGAEVGLSTTGISGPTGGSPEKPVGLVYSAIAAPEGGRVWKSIYPGPRTVVMRRAVATDLNRLRLVLLGEVGLEPR